VDKTLRQFFEGLSGAPQDVRDFLDLVWLDMFPQTTRELDQWEGQFALTAPVPTEQDRRDRLDARWAAQGGQSPRYLQDTLQARGFPVFVHEWWEPGTEAPVDVKYCTTPRDPFLYLAPTTGPISYDSLCGEPLALCGEPLMLCGETGGTPLGYPLVNPLWETFQQWFTLCGEPLALCGEPEALCGNYLTFGQRRRVYLIPVDPAKWAYFLYLGDETFPDRATIPNARRAEFEELALQICPTQQWLGILVEYS
jgi:hypothetical protein